MMKMLENRYCVWVCQRFYFLSMWNWGTSLYESAPLTAWAPLNGHTVLLQRPVQLPGLLFFPAAPPSSGSPADRSAGAMDAAPLLLVCLCYSLISSKKRSLLCYVAPCMAHWSITVYNYSVLLGKSQQNPENICSIKASSAGVCFEIHSRKFIGLILQGIISEFLPFIFQLIQKMSVFFLYFCDVIDYSF